MTIIRFTLPVLAGILLTLAGLINTIAHAATPLDRVAAIVNQGIVLQSELDAELTALQSKMSQAGSPLPPIDVMRSQLLEQLILNELQIQRAQETGIRIGEEQLNATVNSIARNNDLSLGEFARELEAQGIDYIQFRNDLREQLTINQLQQRDVESKILITDREVDALLNNLTEQGVDETDYRLLHILIPVAEDANEVTLQKTEAAAKSLLIKLKQADDFLSIEQAGLTLESSDLGWRKSAELPTIFKETVFALAVGEIGPLIRSASGFHIIKLADKSGGQAIRVKETLARHILLKPNSLRTDSQTQTELIALRQQIIAGADLGSLASQYSEDPGSAAKNGELGWVRPGMLVPPFEAAMDTLEPGQISQPVKSNFGWHLIEVLDRREREVTDEARRGKVREILYRRKLDEERELWLREMRGEAFVEYKNQP